MKTQISSTLAFGLLCYWAVPAGAEYTLILKNGRRISVQSYREEKGLIKFNGMGGEIGISKDQIQAVRRGDAVAPGDLDLTRPETTSQSATDSIAAQEGTGGKTPTPEEERARDEREYQQKLIETTRRLKEVQDRYSESIRGTASPEPNLQSSEEQRAASREDTIARFRDAASNPSEPAPVKLLTPSPFSSLPPTIVENQPVARPPTSPDLPVTETQRELSDLREQMIQFDKERARLIDEMRQKNLNTGSMFLE